MFAAAIERKLTSLGLLSILLTTVVVVVLVVVDVTSDIVSRCSLSVSFKVLSTGTMAARCNSLTARRCTRMTMTIETAAATARVVFMRIIAALGPAVFLSGLYSLTFRRCQTVAVTVLHVTVSDRA